MILESGNGAMSLRMDEDALACAEVHPLPGTEFDQSTPAPLRYRTQLTSEARGMQELKLDIVVIHGVVSLRQGEELCSS